MTLFREARREDVPAILTLLTDDMLGQSREQDDLTIYFDAFDRMEGEADNLLIVGEDPTGRIVASCQLTFITGIAMKAARRAQVESVRVASDLRGQGIGAALFDDIRHRAEQAGCALIQLTMNESRTRSRRFYERLGFTATHTGFKLDLI